MLTSQVEYMANQLEELAKEILSIIINVLVLHHPHLNTGAM